MTIRVLDPTVAAQIAAGEVVERPASVVRELIENALDAGARRISVEARAGGLRELKVQDDGSGIAPGEVELAFARHATSKLTMADDLWAIGTLGFRGEALPSIASVSQLICTTRTADEPVGVELRIAGGEVQSRTGAGCPVGTTISVRNLFYNIPVRRDFLRSESSESSAIAAAVTQYALASPHVRFSLQLDGRLALQTSGDGDLRSVIIELYGLDVARQLLAVDLTQANGREAVTVRGLVSPPGLTRSTRSALHLFVNHRVIQPRGQVAIVIEEAYHTLLMKGRHPLAVLNIEVHPSAVDVNVHPTKSEVKFRDTPLVLGTLNRAVRDALLQSGIPEWEASEPLPQFEAAQRRFELRRAGGDTWRAPELGTRASDTPNQWGEAFQEPEPGIVWGAEPPAPQESEAPAQPAVLPISRLPPLRILGQSAQTYIIADTPDGIFLIDQHAAHERVIYERLLAQYSNGAIERQNLLLPQTIELAPEAHELVLHNTAELEQWGFLIDEFGDQLRVRALPAGLPEGRLVPVLAAMAEQLVNAKSATDSWRDAFLITLACHSAIRAGQSLALEEMQELMAQLAACQVPRTCPHGRPTMILLSKTQLERQFSRTK